MNPEIENSEKLTSIFGRWPSFHDAEVWTLNQERSERGFNVITSIHLFQMTSEVDDRGYFKLQKHTKATLRFIDCEEAVFEGFNRQNVLSGLLISQAPEGSPRPIHVTFDSVYGIEGKLLCSKVQVIEAVPWTPPHGVYANREN